MRVQLDRAARDRPRAAGHREDSARDQRDHESRRDRDDGGAAPAGPPALCEKMSFGRLRSLLEHRPQKVRA